METHLPTKLLSPFINSHVIIESKEQGLSRVLPDTAIILSFQCNGASNYVINGIRNNLPAFALSGLRKSIKQTNFSKDTNIILVRFKETGASAFFKVPLHELFEKGIPLNNFISPEKLSILKEKLSGVKTNEQRIDLIESFLLTKLNGDKPDQLIIEAIKKIYAAGGIIKIKYLADTLCLSQDAFEKRFRRVAGTSPKHFSSIVRMKSLISKGRQAKRYTDIALEAGYFDQPHFNRDFKSFTGQTPGKFFNSPS